MDTDAPPMCATEAFPDYASWGNNAGESRAYAAAFLFRTVNALRMHGKCCYFLVLWAFSCSIFHMPTRMTRLNRESITL